MSAVHTFFRSLRLRSISGCVLASALACCFGCAEDEVAPPAPPAPTAEMARLQLSPGSSPFIVPGVRNPEMLSAEDATLLADDDRVVGVIVDDQSRAYAVRALAFMQSLVVNDFLNQTPVTISYCNRKDHVRAFTKKGRNAPLELDVGGWSGDELLLRLGGQFYRQSSPELSLDELKFERTTWLDWRTKHPQTKVYLGHLHISKKPTTPVSEGLKPAPDADPAP